MKTRRFKN